MELMHLSPEAFLLLAIFWKIGSVARKAERERREEKQAPRVGEHGPLGKRIV
jgi:hypothetical protein